MARLGIGDLRGLRAFGNGCPGFGAAEKEKGKSLSTGLIVSCLVGVTSVPASQHMLLTYIHRLALQHMPAHKLSTGNHNIRS